MSNPYAPPRGGQGPGDGRPTADDGAPGTAGHSSGTPGSGEHGSGGDPSGAGRPPGGPPERGTPPPWFERRPPGPPRPTPPPDPEALRVVSRQVLDFSLLLLASLLFVRLPLPWQAASVVFSLVALVVGIRALRRALAAGLRGLVVPTLGLGLAIAGLISLSGGMTLALWPLQVERQECLRDALTISATEACEEQFQEGLLNRQGAGQRSPSPVPSAP